MKTLALVTTLSLSLVSWTLPTLTPANQSTGQNALTVTTSVSSPLGRVYGPANVSRRVSAYSTYTDYILFRGGEVAEVVVEGDGDCDLDLYVYNPDGDLVAKDDDNTDYCVVRWTPNYTKSYRIVVKNRGYVYADYLLKSN